MTAVHLADLVSAMVEELLPKNYKIKWFINVIIFLW